MIFFIETRNPVFRSDKIRFRLRLSIDCFKPILTLGLSEQFSLVRLQDMLSSIGLSVYDDDFEYESSGYPLVVPLPDGRRLVFDLTEPALFSNHDPQELGVAILSSTGVVKRRWGIAESLDSLEPHGTLSDSDLANLVMTCARERSPGSMYLDGRRYYVAPSSVPNAKSDVVLFVTNATEEQGARDSATLQARSADVFRRIGKALTMHQTLDELAVLAVHEIASAAGLAAVLLWAKSLEDDRLSLRAHVGVSRQGAAAVYSLDPTERLSCPAELVASRRQVFWVNHVNDNMMTSALEGKFCYLQAGGVCALPLITGDRVIGVLELIGREGDPHFKTSRELFEVIAEHLTLSLNTCMMFESVQRLATHDPMTGLANHRTLQDFLHARVSESERNGTQIGVVMLDVDHFRSFNEEEGHDAGDTVLKRVANVIQEAVRPYDLAARYGGEEFSIIMPGLGMDFTLEVAERIRKLIEEIEYTTATGRIRHVTASLGVACYPQTAKEPAGLLKAADVALFRAKRAGRNQVVSYEGILRDENLNEDDEDSGLERWFTPEDRIKSDHLFAKLKPFYEFICRGLMLSKAQAQILENLIRIYPTYTRIMATHDATLLRQIELAAEFRPLLPSLMMSSERFDGDGPMGMQGQRIPLLARILAVLLSIANENGRSLLHDSRRYDPEIISLVAEVQEAA